MRRLVAFVVVAMFAGVAGAEAQQKPAAPAPAPATAQPAAAAAPAPSAATAAFWKWFQKNAAALRKEKSFQRTMERINKVLEKGHPGVFAEIGADGDDRVLTISADGKVELFPAVKEVYAARPTVPGWKIIAFRPRWRTGDNFVIKMGGKELDPQLMKFTGARKGDKLEISVFVPGFTTLEELGLGGFIVLDHVVGEYDMETKIGGIRWAAIGKAPATARPLTELPAFLDKAFSPKP